MFLHTTVDLFAGIGGWEALERNHQGRIGVETAKHARATRQAAGLQTIAADVRELGPRLFPRLTRLLGSPPCQTFSQSGDGAGVKHLHLVEDAAWELNANRTTSIADAVEDERSRLVLEPLRWALEAIWLGRPLAAIALEQVPSVLPVWRRFGQILEGHGYGWDAAVLNAEEYGVPQARQRAVLVATLGRPVALPIGTHSRYVRRGAGKGVLQEGRLPYVTMANALDWEWPTRRDPGRPGWAWDRPATTVVASFRADVIVAPGYRTTGDGPRQHTPNSASVSLGEALLLQSFPPDWPVQGPEGARRRQVGNAIPPLMAAAVQGVL